MLQNKSIEQKTSQTIVYRISRSTGNLVEFRSVGTAFPNEPATVSELALSFRWQCVERQSTFGESRSRFSPSSRAPAKNRLFAIIWLNREPPERQGAILALSIYGD